MCNAIYCLISIGFDLAFLIEQDIHVEVIR